MPIKMIVTDMDGTLLDEKGEFDRDRLKNILDELDKRGMRFVVATGNEIHRMRLLFGDLLERVTLIAANGARIFDKNEILLGTCWSPDLVAQVLSYFEGRERDVHLVVTAENGAFVKTGTIFPMIEKVMTAEMAQEILPKDKLCRNITSRRFSASSENEYGGKRASSSSGYSTAQSGFCRLIKCGHKRLWSD